MWFIYHVPFAYLETLDLKYELTNSDLLKSRTKSMGLNLIIYELKVTSSDLFKYCQEKAQIWSNVE